MKHPSVEITVGAAASQLGGQDASAELPSTPSPTPAGVPISLNQSNDRIRAQIR